MATKEKAFVKETLGIYWRVTISERRAALLSLGLPAGVILRSVIAPFLASMVIASLIRSGDQTMSYFIWLVIVSLVGVGFELIGIRQLMILQAKCLATLHEMTFRHLLQRSTGFYANRISGKLISDVNDFINGYSTLISNVFINGLGFFLIVTIGLVIVLFNSWQLGLFLAALVAIALIWTVLDARFRSDMRQVRHRASKKLIAHMSDTIVNATTVKTFANESDELDRSLRLNNHLESIRISDWLKAVTSANLRNAFVISAQLIMIFLLIKLAKNDPTVIAAGIFAFTYTLTISNRLFDLNTITRQVEEAFLQAQPITEILGQKVEIIDAANATDLTVSRGEISLKTIGFSYTERSSSQAVFKDLSITIAPGERVGLVGPSGGGKSTLTRLLLRFDEPQSGVIAIDGQDITTITQQSLRQAIAYVPQEPLLFHRSIRENITYGKVDASNKDIIRAAKQAHAHDFITKLENGYDTIVGERGVKLSGGQRQRVAIARAILKKAPILILDEATSALDSESEVLIQAALWQLMKNSTAIVIAHRLSTIQKLDRIIVLDEGRIIEQGTHKQLLAANGLYAKLWSHQSGGFIEE